MTRRTTLAALLAALTPVQGRRQAPIPPRFLTVEERLVLAILDDLGTREALDRLTLSGRYQWVADAFRAPP